MISVLILFGGLSSEHEVSCMSAASILQNIDREKYDVTAVGITRNGCWKLYDDADPEKVRTGLWEREPGLRSAILAPDRAVHGLIIDTGRGTTVRYIDVCFPVLHGFGGEDGTMQGLLTLAGIPYVGPGVAASANSMDKSLTKIIVEKAGVRQADYFLALRPDFDRDPVALTCAAEAALGGKYPMFVKPCSSGSSVGVTRANDFQTLLDGLREGFRWDGKVLVEEFIDGHEVEVAVLGNHSPIASVAGEVAPTQTFYSYDAKYNDASSELYIPAHIPAEAMETVRANALRVYAALGCRGLSRVDFFCTYADNEIVFNEINTLPGFTSISMYPKLFAHEGIGYADLIDNLLQCALEEHHG